MSEPAHALSKNGKGGKAATAMEISAVHTEADSFVAATVSAQQQAARGTGSAAPGAGAGVGDMEGQSKGGRGKAGSCGTAAEATHAHRAASIRRVRESETRTATQQAWKGARGMNSESAKQR